MPLGRESQDNSDAGSPQTLAVNDETFCRQIDRLKKLNEFLFQEAVPRELGNSPILGIGEFAGICFSTKGRTPSVEEWTRLEERTQAAFRVLSPALRRKFLMGGTPWVVAWLPVYFLGLAVFSLVFAMFLMNAVDWPEYSIFFVYLVWLASLGAIGALAFIGMNALSIQDDITFDLTNMRLLSLRVALGILFAVVLTVPFGYPEFLKFCKAIWKPSEFYDPNGGVLTKQAIFLLLPFILGFSTSLVILVLTQLVEAAQAFLGRRSGNVTTFLSGPMVGSDHPVTTSQKPNARARHHNKAEK